MDGCIDLTGKNPLCMRSKLHHSLKHPIRSMMSIQREAPIVERHKAHEGWLGAFTHVPLSFSEVHF